MEEQQKKQIISQFLENRIRPDLPALSEAISFNKLDVAKEIINSGADVNEYAKRPAAERGMAPIHFANTPEAVELLASAGANINIPYKEVDHAWGMRGETKLHTASISKSSNLPLVEALLKAGADATIPYGNEYKYDRNSNVGMDNRIIRGDMSVTERIEAMREAKAVSERELDDLLSVSKSERQIDVSQAKDNQNVTPETANIQSMAFEEIDKQEKSIDVQAQYQDIKSRVEVQWEADRNTMLAIGVRARERERNYVLNGENAELDKAMANADASDFKKIKNAHFQEQAALDINNNMRTYHGYWAEMTIVDPDVKKQVAALNPEGIKNEEVQELDKMWAFKMASSNVKAARDRDFAQVREILGLNSIEPNVEKQRQQLTGEEEEKRSAWLKKAEQPKSDIPASNPKNNLGNKVESDEIFTASQSDVKPVVPQEIERQYFRVGDKFYHPKNTELVAFEDKGNKLETKSDSGYIAESLVRIAEARGWDEIKVSGSETFRKEVWLEAATRGMHVKGYSPSEIDKAELAKRLSETEANKIEKDNKPFRARENNTEQPEKNSDKAANDKVNKDGIDVLVAHGAAKYMHDEKNNGSYYVTTRNNTGTEKTSWGVDLERALNESGARIGDKITVVNDGKKPVTVSVPIHDDAGKVVGSKEKDVIRNSWNIKMAETFANESAVDAVKKYPELAGAAAAVEAMEKKAEADGLTPAQRAIVSARVRQNVVNSIERGDIPQVKIKEDIQVKLDKKEEREYSR